ncbi:alkaline phosphatase family protein [Guptibacillus algicola]|uniref:alkaline phosphatase family protein n=1 Tax=Guptibacillus algicola TaxID=225844 RepID=UPI001CD60510|nr:alkaline phosphatase family protein [Alkalihalobacillus algicola]MCA0986277.1 alkaline phosphatase family protein [Alkalihalobacillus algicola]
MKQASGFEKVAARCWNLLNEGKPFTPIFVTGTVLLFYITQWSTLGFWSSFFIGFAAVLPLLVLYYNYDYPLFLRNYLWIPLVGYLLLFDHFSLTAALLAVSLYFFFTVFFWGTFYYHLRIGTSWLNFTRFWKLVLKNSDSTSGNAQEQLPKFLLIIPIWVMVIDSASISSLSIDWTKLLLFYAGIWLFSFILHRNLFDWKPDIKTSYTDQVDKPITQNERVIMIVIDGMRKERFQEANTPFLDSLKKNGTEYSQMETVYPARTVVCFSSMMTGTYPFEHGIKSNMVWNEGVKVETIFDSLRKVNKSGRLLGIAHLVDAMGDDVDTVTAVMNNDVADTNIMGRARQVMKEKDPSFFALQLIGTDQTGHARGVLYDEYIQKIEEADRLIEEYVNWLEEHGYMENTTLIVCADHGQADGIGGHGHLDEGERFVPFFMNGPTIASGKVIEDKHSLTSVAPTVSYLIGAPIPSHSRGSILTDAFEYRKEETSK